MAWVTRVVWAMFLGSGFRQCEAIVGDQTPPAYPILDVHVPEPMVGSMQKQWAAEENQQMSQQLDTIEQRLTASAEVLRIAMEPLTAKIEQAAATAENAISLFSGSVAMQKVLK